MGEKREQCVECAQRSVGAALRGTISWVSFGALFSIKPSKVSHPDSHPLVSTPSITHLHSLLLSHPKSSVAYNSSPSHPFLWLRIRDSPQEVTGSRSSRQAEFLHFPELQYRGKCLLILTW